MGTSLVQWNIRGARANSVWLRHSFFANTDIIALQETFLSPSHDFSLPGKIIYRSDRTARRGGGLITAVSRKLASRVIHPPCASLFCEVLGVEIYLSFTFRLQVFNVYCPPGRISGRWLDDLLSFCNPPFVIVGDFNCYHTCWGGRRNTAQGAVVVDWLLRNNICLVNASVPTRISPGGRSTLLDLSIVSPDLYADTDFVVHSDTFDSDHCPIKLVFNCWGLSPSPNYITRFRYDWGAASTQIRQWIGGSIISSFDDLLRICRDSLDGCSRKTRFLDKGGTPWWDSRCSYLLGQKRKHLRLARRLLSTHHWVQYKKFSAILRKEILDAKRTYWGETCRQAGRSGFIFKLLRSLRNRKSSPLASHLYIATGQGPSSREMEANLFAQTFTNLKIDSHIPLDFSANEVVQIRRKFTFTELNNALVKSSNRTPGKDGIPLRLLQSFDEVSREKLLASYNKIWDTCIIPQSWRDTIIVPILKPGKDASLPSSYRPISLTSIFAKVFERMLLERIISWVLERDLFHPNHYGFIPFKDCTPALMKIYTDLISAKRNKQVSVIVALDLSSAYDSVWPDGLGLKMLSAGVDGHFTKWVLSFMQRSVQVRWKGILSDPFESDIGVPQGAVLSPVLFSLYMSDIFEVFGSSIQGVVYADDIFMYCSGFDLEEVMRKLQEALNNVAKWCEYWKLRLNPGKSSALVLHSRQSLFDSHLGLRGEDIPWVTSLRILGLTFESGLSWRKQVSNLRTKTARKINAFKCVAHLSRGASTRVLLRLAQSTVISSLNHGSQIYSFACSSTRKTLEPVLNAALRVALGLPRWTPIPILRREAKALTVGSTLDLHRECFLIRHVALGVRSPINDLVNLDGHSVLSDMVKDIISKLQIGYTDIIRWILPSPRNEKIGFIIDTLGFQSKKIHPDLVSGLFNEYLAYCEDWHLVATDASKSGAKTCIAFWDMLNKTGHSSQINNINSIFTAEALAIDFALDFAPPDGKIIIFSDSRSVVTSLQTVSYKSPRVVLYVYDKLTKAAGRFSAIQVVWVPGHAGIYGNEMADMLARSHGLPVNPGKWVSPEDICRRLRQIHFEEDSNEWLLGKYSGDFYHLTKKSWEHRKLQLPRRGEVLLCRLRTRTLPTRSLLFKLNMCSSPLCSSCNVPETCDHYLLDCRQYSSDRSCLYAKLGVVGSSPSFGDLCDLAVSGAAQARALVSFLLRSNRF